tara:strand:- start:910 stop:1359 length:450 start_codon:yes stop_codon:yes gene_type:complete
MAAQIWPSVYSSIISSDQISFMLDWMYSPETMQQEISREGIVYHWITLQERPIGFLAVGPILPDTASMLHKCYILSEEQGNGHGTTALNKLSDQLREADVTTLRLRVNRKNQPAIHFYQRYGFETESEDLLDIGHGFVMDDYIMALTLS